ncbi:ATP-binding protein [Streptomyces tsukubensis]|uniref:ATP-binding protein n=1 Tax=Streptomyces tsukubensis TaxID=83656 RepID=UPI00344BB9B8
MTDVDPACAGTSEEYLLLLRQRREVAGLSYRQLERRARRDGGSLPPSTVATMLRRSTLPGPDLIAVYVRACGGGTAEVARWLAARARIAAAAVAGTVAAPLEHGSLPTRAVPAAGRAAAQYGTAGFVGPARSEGMSQGTVPRQLPPAAALVGAGRPLTELDALAGRPGAGLAIVTGPPGSGKSAVAVNWAHQAADRFPDGQLYVDLRGHRPGVSPLPTAEALRYLLVGLGVPAQQIPADEGQAAAAFRSLVADRKMLLLLDGAVSAEQVRLLRPGGSGIRTVVTSRDGLAGLAVHDGGRTVRIGHLDWENSVRLFACAAGEHLVVAEPEAARGLAALCDGLPLALLIAAVALDTGARAPVAGLLSRMRGEGPLSALELHADGCAGLEAVYACSYEALEDPEQRMFRLLGSLAAAVFAIPVTAAFTVPMAATIAGLPVTTGRAVLRRLADAHLLSRLPGDRYTVPRLLRDYARRLPREEPAFLPGITAAAHPGPPRVLLPSRPTAGV